MKAASDHSRRNRPDLKITTENPELAGRFNRILEETVEALEESGLRYVFIGGIASGGLGRPRSTHDIDVFVQPEDAENALRALAKYGFRTEKTDPVWLYKAFKEDILVDIIFKSKGDIYLDAEMFSRAAVAEFHGKSLKLVSPEDLVIIKAAAHSEVTPGHWHDALALLSHAEIDWQYLLKRARRAPRRVLSLLLYAQSSDIWVPRTPIDLLYKHVFGDEAPAKPSPAPHSAAPANVPKTPLRVVPQVRPTDTPTTIARVREALAESPRTNELDIQLEITGGKLLLRGEVMTDDRLEAVREIAAEIAPDLEVVNQIRVVELKDPASPEDLR